MSEREQILQSCLDEIDREGLTVAECLSRHEEDIEWLGPLLTTAERFSKAPAVKPSEAFQTAARARMLNMIGASRVVRTRPSEPFRRRPYVMLLRASVACFVLMVAVASTSYVAMAAYPESPLYPIKLALEETRLLLAGSDQERLELRLEIAERRTSELVSMLHRGAPAAEVERVASLLESNVREIARLAVTADGESVVNELQPRLENQEAVLKAAAGSGSKNTETGNGLERVIGVLERERNELRIRSSNDKVGTPTPSPDDDVQLKGHGRNESAEPIQATPSPLPSAVSKKDIQIVHETVTPRSDGRDEDEKTPISDRRSHGREATPETASGPGNPALRTESTPGVDSLADPIPSGPSRGRGETHQNEGAADSAVPMEPTQHQPSDTTRSGEPNRSEKATPTPTAPILTPTQPSDTPTPAAESKVTGVLSTPTPTSVSSPSSSRGSNNPENRGQGEPSASSQTAGGGNHGAAGSSSSSGRR